MTPLPLQPPVADPPPALASPKDNLIFGRAALPLALAAPALATGIAGLLGLGLLAAAALSHAGEAPSWVSIGADDRELSWPLPPSGELLRVCECGNNAYGERLCHCTQPAATLEASLRTPIALDVQVRRNLPAAAPVPRARLRYAGQPDGSE